MASMAERGPVDQIVEKVAKAVLRQRYGAWPRWAHFNDEARVPLLVEAEAALAALSIPDLERLLLEKKKDERRYESKPGDWDRINAEMGEALTVARRALREIYDRADEDTVVQSIAGRALFSEEGEGVGG